MRASKGEKAFSAVNAAIMLLIMFITIYPLWYVLVASLSKSGAVTAGLVKFWPIGLELASYKRVFEMKHLWSSYANSVYYAVFGTAISMALTTIGAYALSKRRLAGRKAIMFVLLFTMWFAPGMMPTFLNFRSLGLYNNRMAILLCGAVATFYVILMRTYFESIPDSMEESAKMDGANDLVILFRIYLPLSVPILATLTMYYFVGRWNSYFWSMILISDQTKIPLQVLLKRLIVETTYAMTEYADIGAGIMTETTIVYATIIVSVIPMLALYPFIQKYFVKGVMVGAIKG